MRITYSEIKKNIIELDKNYNSTRSDRKKRLYSKLALLELCGWIEETMDEIFFELRDKHISEQKHKQVINAKIKRNSNMDYENNFVSILSLIIGYKTIEKIENNINTIKYVNLTSSLSNLKTIRNSYAHTHINAGTGSYYSPSYILGEFSKVLSGLRAYNLVLRKIN